MASLALGIIGTVVGGPIGGMIGSTIGSLIDNKLFPQKQQGPRLQDLSVQVSTYGQMIPKLYGPENRITGNVIYSSGLIETKHKSSSKGGPSVETTSFTYSTNIAVLLADAQRKPIVGIVKVWANSKLIYSAPGASGSVVPDPVSAKVWAEMVFHDGAFDQMPDSLLEGAIGIGDVPAYRGSAYVVIWGLQLADYGNRIPQLEFLTEADDEITVAEVVTDIVGLCGIDRNSVSAAGLTDKVRGYAIATASSGTAALQPLALVYNFDSVSVAGALRFTPRGAGIRGIIPDYLMAGHQGGEDRPELIHWTRDAETQMPQQATITFADPARDYQVNAQIARRVAGSAASSLSNQVPIVIDVPAGAQLADRMLWEAWNSRDTATFQGDDRLIDVLPGRSYLVTTPAGLEPVRIKTKQRGANGVIVFECARDRSEVYQSTRIGVPSDSMPQVINVPLPTILFLLDAPLLQDADDNTGFYFVADGQAGWRGADIVRSIDGGLTFDEMQPVGRQTVLGQADQLGAGVTEVIDQVNVLRVVLDDPTDELESVSMETMLAGNNACWVGTSDGQGGEVLQFLTATMTGAGVYELTGLLRGRLGTEYAVDGHGSGEVFVLLDSAAIYRKDFGPADWNKARSYKAVSLLTYEADTAAQDFTNTGEGKRPLSPVHIVAETDPGAGDTAITWIRRSRYRQPGLGNGPVALAEETEAYEVDVIVLGVVVRTITTTVPGFTYTAAERVADSGSGDTVQIAVYQMSGSRGRGHAGFAEV